MIRKLLKDEAGYSLVEVIASIMILAIAIIPMVSMFDAGLNAASTSGNYDKARAFANQQLETAKSLSYDEARTSFPNGGCTPTGSQEKECPDLTDDLPQGLTSYTVAKRFINEQLENASNGEAGMMKVTVTVDWGDGQSYSTTGVVGE